MTGISPILNFAAPYGHSFICTFAPEQATGLFGAGSAKPVVLVVP